MFVFNEFEINVNWDEKDQEYNTHMFYIELVKVTQKEYDTAFLLHSICFLLLKRINQQYICSTKICFLIL
jgi:hypothetical protein